MAQAQRKFQRRLQKQRENTILYLRLRKTLQPTLQNLLDLRSGLKIAKALLELMALPTHSLDGNAAFQMYSAMIKELQLTKFGQELMQKYSPLHRT